MLVKIFILNFLLQILNGCKSTNELNEGKIDCKCTSPDVQNQIAKNLYSYIILEIGTGTDYNLNVTNIKNITKDNLKQIITNITNKVEALNDQNLHCYAQMWINNTSKIANIGGESDAKNAVNEFFKVCKTYDSKIQFENPKCKDCSNYCPPKPTNELDCKCEKDDAQNQIATNLYSYIILEIGTGTDYNLNVTNIKNITKDNLKQIVKRITNKVEALKDQNLHCYKSMWAYNSDKIINLISTSKDAVNEFFKVCNKFDGNNNPQNINYWNLGNRYTGNFFDSPNSCLGGIQPVPPVPPEQHS